MTFKILTFSNRSEWDKIIASLPEKSKDIHYTTQYVQIYLDTFNQEPFLAYCEEEGNFIIQVFVKKLINRFTFISTGILDKEYYDITNPYGYGGPIISTNNVNICKVLFTKFRLKLSSYCKNNYIVTEFTSIHPFFGVVNLLNCDNTLLVEKVKNIAYVNLEESREEIWKNMSKSNRSDIRKSEKNNVIIKKVAINKKNLEIMNQLYLLTMMRKHADRRWLFPESYFTNCFNSLGPKRISMFFATYKEKIIACQLIIHDFKTSYNHFNGSDSEYFWLRANNLLLYKTIQWSKDMGYSYFHLGGGVTNQPDDSLWKYKKSFSDTFCQLNVYKVIHNVKIYKQLLFLSKTTDDGTYFPAYRKQE